MAGHAFGEARGRDAGRLLGADPIDRHQGVGHVLGAVDAIRGAISRQVMLDGIGHTQLAVEV